MALSLGATPGLEGSTSPLTRRRGGVWLLLFDRPDGDPTDIIRVQDRDRFQLARLRPRRRRGQFYGYKVAGPLRPGRGLRFNDRKLHRPVRESLTGKIVNRRTCCCPTTRATRRGTTPRPPGNQAVVPKAIVVDDRFDWGGDAPPSIPFERMVIYETHLKGFTAHPSRRWRTRVRTWASSRRSRTFSPSE